MYEYGDEVTLTNQGDKYSIQLWLWLWLEDFLNDTLYHIIIYMLFILKCIWMIANILCWLKHVSIHRGKFWKLSKIDVRDDKCIIQF